VATILLTGFGRFPGAASNPSGLLARKLARIRRPALANVERVAHVFATSYVAVDRQLPALIARHQPDAIVMFGLATRATRVGIELQARNRVRTLFPDATGFSPRGPMIRAQGPARLAGRGPLTRLLTAVRATGIPAALSRNAGSYVCNYCYWRALESAPSLDRPRIVVFVHVPAVRSVRRFGSTQRVPRFADLARAGEAILATVVAGLQTPR
jgi:pyroglutamyl-peptidase